MCRQPARFDSKGVEVVAKVGRDYVFSTVTNTYSDGDHKIAAYGDYRNQNPGSPTPGPDRLLSF